MSIWRLSKAAFVAALTLGCRTPVPQGRQVAAPDGPKAHDPAAATAPSPVGPTSSVRADRDVAEGVSPACDDPKSRQFDFWIGEWDVENRQRAPGGTGDLQSTGTAHDRVYAILDGCAIVEHWEGHLAYGDVRGFSLRAWDPDKGAWQLVGHWPIGQATRVGYREGTFEDGVGTFLFEIPVGPMKGRISRYRFEDIQPDGLTWRGSFSDDRGETWTDGWIMTFHRRNPLTDRALFVGPNSTPDIEPFCDVKTMRQFDFLTGVWEGHTEGEDPQPVEIQGYRINGGCTMIDFMTVGTDENPFKRFRVRAYDPHQEKWVQYAVSNRDPTLHPTIGTFAPDQRSIELVTPEPGTDTGLPRFRETWRDITLKSAHWTLAKSADGTVWGSVMSAALRRGVPKQTTGQ